MKLEIVSIIEEAHNISNVALDTVCWALLVQNTTNALIAQLNTADVPRVFELVRQMESLVESIQLTGLVVFNSSTELVDQVPASLPSYNIKSMNTSIFILYQQVSELSENARTSFQQLQNLKQQAGDLNVTIMQLLQRGVGLEKLANQLLESANASQMNSRQGFNQAQPIIDEIQMLFTNLTKYSDLIKEFNANLTEARDKLAEADNITSGAENVTLAGQLDVENAQQLIEKVRSLLDEATRTYGEILTVSKQCNSPHICVSVSLRPGCMLTAKVYSVSYIESTYSFLTIATSAI